MSENVLGAAEFYSVAGSLVLTQRIKRVTNFKLEPTRNNQYYLIFTTPISPSLGTETMDIRRLEGVNWERFHLLLNPVAANAYSQITQNIKETSRVKTRFVVNSL